MQNNPGRYFGPAIFRGILKICWLSIFGYLPILLPAQNPVVPATQEQQMESMAESNAQEELEDDSYLQQMQQYLKDPVNLNYAGADELRELGLLDPLRVEQLLIYRNVFGKFIDIYELQAVPGWNVELLRKLKPFITVEQRSNIAATFAQRIGKGEHSLLLRTGQVLERSKGYLADTATNFYPGSPQKLLLRYKYQFKNLLQYGILGEKDAGEQFFKGNQKQGFDFYSFHLFIRNAGRIKALALGDFTVNLGQGLIQWQSMAFKKSVAVLNAKREATVLRPYNAAGEINFHRGIGITVGKNKWEATAFISYRKIDGNFVHDSLLVAEDFISSLQTSGYHRTQSELADKGIQQQLAMGGNISYRFKKLRIGFNTIQYKFKLPLQKEAEPYNLYALTGKTLGNSSFDYSYTHQNMHFFGELAITNHFDKAFINGLLLSAAPEVDLCFLYRDISPAYQSLYSTAFTENSTPTNEKGFYMGIAVRPASAWTINAYADFYKFPWLKFGVNAPAAGTEYLMQVSYKPNKQVEAYTSFRSGIATANDAAGSMPLTSLATSTKLNWRSQFSFQLSPQTSISSRVELTNLNKKTTNAEQGSLVWLSIFHKPARLPLSINARWLYFETDSYNSRIYTYENDLLYYFSIPAFYDKGAKYYININYHINKRLQCWLKWAQTFYKNKTLIGSGLDAINSPVKSEIRVQTVYKF
ncbi:ComEA family DNA-binding protein [Ferruginibacter sp.]